MGIKPSGDEPVIVPPDNPQNRWGDWEADLRETGEVAGEASAQTWSLADSANQLASWLEEQFTGIPGKIADAIRGLLPTVSPWTPVQDAFRDQQLDLKNRLDLIPMGYCAAYMDRNVNLEWSGGERRLPFRAQLGPAKGAHVDTANERIVFDVTGTWTVHVLASFNGTIFGGDGRVHIDVFVRNPDGSLYSRWRVRDAPGGEEGSLSCSKPVVIDKTGMWVDVVCRSGKWRWWSGGTRFSGLSVVRSALETDNRGTDEVPDETNPKPETP